MSERDCSVNLIRKIFDCLEKSDADIMRLVDYCERENKHTISIFFVIDFLVMQYYTTDKQISEALFDVINQDIKSYFENHEINLTLHPTIRANYDLNNLILKRMISDANKSADRINTYLHIRTVLNGQNLFSRYNIDDVYTIVNEFLLETTNR